MTTGRAGSTESSPVIAVPQGLLNRIVARLDPAEIILFGSRARGAPRPDSDWDLLIVLDDDAPPEQTSLRALHEARRGFPGAVDLVPMRAATFRSDAPRPGTLAHEASCEGVTVYRRAARHGA